MKNCYSIGFGGAYNSNMAFDIGSFSGGTVMDSLSYEISVQDLMDNGFPHLSEEEANTI